MATMACLPIIYVEKEPLLATGITYYIPYYLSLITLPYLHTDYIIGDVMNCLLTMALFPHYIIQQRVKIL